jgi:signal transduction histidine kinase
MSGLSGAEFVLLAPAGRIQESTLRLEPSAVQDLAETAKLHRVNDRTQKPVIALAGRPYLVDCVTVSGRSYFAGTATLFILYREDQLASHIHQAVYPALLAGAVAAAVAVAMAAWLARRFARPIRTLGEQTAAIAQGGFIPMPIPRRNDELRDLAESINHMTGKLADYERQVRHNERLRTLGQLGAAMAHQLRNAATGGRMAIELHRRDCHSETTDECLDVALRQLCLMESYLRQFLSLESPTPVVCQRVDIGRLAEETLNLLRPSFTHAGIPLSFACPAEPLFLQGDPGAIRQLVTNLVVNALEAARTENAAPAGVQVELGAAQDGLGSLRVYDSGPGPALSIQDKLFDSFVTTKPDGVGLGLFVARQIAQRHAGQLHWERHDDRTCFVFEFPLFCEPDHGTRTDC